MRIPDFTPPGSRPPADYNRVAEVPLTPEIPTEMHAAFSIALLLERAVKNLNRNHDNMLKCPAAITKGPEGGSAEFVEQIQAKRVRWEMWAQQLRQCGKVFTGSGERQIWSIELIRDHSLLHGQTLDAGDLGEGLGALTCLVAQYTPGLRPVRNTCDSYPAAVAYLRGLCSVQQHTAQSLRDALIQFRHCLQLAENYTAAWCGLADVWLGKAMLGLCALDRAVDEAYGMVSRALSLDPANHQALVRLALLTSLRGCEEAAKVLFRRCLLHVEQADVHFFHAWHHWFWRRNEQAAQSLEKCLRYDPDCVRATIFKDRIALASNHADVVLMGRQTLQTSEKASTPDSLRCLA
ncbi:winged helix-turn-helix domain-containing protein [Pseudomonas azerbaijanoccidentalis]